MSQKTAIVTDSTVDLADARAQALGLEVGRVTYVIDGEPTLISLAMDAPAFIARVDRRTQRASSAGVNADEFRQCFERALARAPEVLCITMPRKISSTWTFGVTAADLFEPGQVEMFDSHQVHLGEAALVVEAAGAALAGLARAEIAAALAESVQASATYIAGASFGVLEDIGRLKGRTAGMGDQYNVQRVGNDEFRAFATAGSGSEAVERMLDGVEADTPAGSALRVVITHVSADEPVRALTAGILARRPASRVEAYGGRPNVAFFGGGSGSFAIGFCPLLKL